MALSPAQIYALARDAGFDRPHAVTMTAIALAESGGNPGATNITSREESYGLWQINVKANTDFRGQNLLDPRTNAKAAKVIYDRQGYGAWSVFTTTDPKRSYTRYLGDALSASGQSETSIADYLRGIPVAARTLAGVAGDVAGAVPGQAAEMTGIPGIARALGQGVELATKAGNWLTNPQNLVRVVYVFVGAQLILVGLFLVAAPTILKTVAPTGRAAKVARRIAT
jgi:hypothetical protein